jgi:hypothetical protein
MNYLINNYIFISKTKYNFNKTKELSKFESLHDNSILYKNTKTLYNINSTKYNYKLYYIRPSFQSNTSNFKIDNINYLTYLDHTDNILKTKLITWPHLLYNLILYNYLSLNRYINDNTLIASYNHGLVELLLFNKCKQFDHLYYIRNFDNHIQTQIETQIETLKEKFMFNNYKYGIKLKKKYKLMIFDLIITRIYAQDLNDEIQFKKILEEKEKSNLFLLENLYIYLDNLEEDGELIIVIGLYLMEETLLILENIFNCFEYVKLYKFSYFASDFPYIHCRNFKKKVKKQDHLSENFYNFIKKIYDQSIILSDIYIYYNNYINNLLIDRNNSDELKQIENKNLYISNEVAKYIGLETYLIQDNLNLTLFNNLQNLFLMDEPILITISNELGLDNYKIILNKNNLSEELKIIYKKYKKSIKQLQLRPVTILNNITNEIVNYKQSIIEIVNNKNTNKKDQITDIWIQIFELLNIINFKELNKNLRINLLHLCSNLESIQAILYYMIKFMPDIQLDWNKLYNSDCKSCNKQDIIDSIYKNMDWIICNNIMTDIKMKYSNIIYILYNLKENGSCILNFTIPIKERIIIDLFYLFYLSFEKILFVKPIQNKFDNNFYIICINYKKIITNFHKLFDILDNEEIKTLSVIDEYSNDFKYKFIKIINLLTSNLIETIDIQLFYTDFWNRLDGNIKDEIKNTINIKNKNYIKKYFN